MYESPTSTAPSKASVDDLALFGGAAMFDEPLHVGRPNLGDRMRLKERIDGVFARRTLTNFGPLADEFERRISSIVGVRHVLAVPSATSGLEILARTLGLRGEVVLPSFTFVGTAHALAWQGIRPVFCDIDPETLTIDPAMAERLITPDTSAIVGVHLWGRMCDTEALEQIGQRAGIPVIYDAAHAFGCSRDGRMAGNFGSAEVFSFHATKVINSFEGGAICTDDDGIAEVARRTQNFGITDWDASVAVGTNGKMHEASAAMGLTSLDAADSIIATNHQNLALYSRLLAGIDGVRLLTYSNPSETNAHYVVVRVGPEAALDRDQLQKVLVAEGVLARRYFYPGCHRMGPYVDRPGGHAPLPVTEKVAGEVLALPTGTAVGDADIAVVCELIRFAMEHGAPVAARLSR